MTTEQLEALKNYIKAVIADELEANNPDREIDYDGVALWKAEQKLKEVFLNLN
jgi:hypothetical protein